jgi:hypothetical protein
VVHVNRYFTDRLRLHYQGYDMMVETEESVSDEAGWFEPPCAAVSHEGLKAYVLGNNLLEDGTEWEESIKTLWREMV